MQLVVLPVSGGAFVVQLAIVRHLSQVRYRPDLTLSSSGGNVVAYIAAAGDWQWAAITRISQDLSWRLFVDNWCSVSSISYIIGFFSDVFKHGKGVPAFIERHFSDDTIQKYEIWTGTFNKTRRQSHMFCNRSPDTSVVNYSAIDREITQSLPPTYLDGHLPTIATVTVASATIPGLVPPQTIDKELYVDGGMCGASPLSTMEAAFVGLPILHITYITPENLSGHDGQHDAHIENNVLDTIHQASQDILRSQTMMDRKVAYGLLSARGLPIEYETFPCNYETLSRVMALRAELTASLLEIYPINRVEEKWRINITNFTNVEINQSVEEIYGHCACRFWYIK